jgi:hypothetical protein
MLHMGFSEAMAPFVLSITQLTLKVIELLSQNTNVTTLSIEHSYIHLLST